MSPPELVRRLGVGDDAPLIIFAAHPDDETIGCGRLVAHWAEQIGPCTAVLATLGEACIDHVAQRPPGLAARRLQEWRSATRRLGVTRTMVLDFADGQLEVDSRRLQERIDQLLDRRPRSGPPPVLAAPYRLDPHPDHRAVGEAVARAGRRRGWPVLHYPIWLTYWTDPDRFGDALQRVPVGLEADQAYAEALACFTSQLEPLAVDLTPVVPDQMLAHHPRQLLVTDGPR